MKRVVRLICQFRSRAFAVAQRAKKPDFPLHLVRLWTLSNALVWALGLGSGVAGTPPDEEFIDHGSEVMNKLLICLAAPEKCGINAEPEVEQECHRDANNRLCCKTIGSLSVEIETKLFKPSDTKEIVGGAKERDQNGSKADAISLLSNGQSAERVAHQTAETVKNLLEANPRFTAPIGSEEECVEFKELILRNYTPLFQGLIRRDPVLSPFLGSAPW